MYYIKIITGLTHIKRFQRLFANCISAFNDPIALFGMAGKAVQALGWLIAIPLVTTCLTAAEQGFYYTFASLVALQIFVELGMSGVLVQILSHSIVGIELPKVKGRDWGGNKFNLGHLSLVVRFANQWYLCAGATVAIGLCIVGQYFLTSVNSKEAVPISWFWPWVVLAVATGAAMWNIGRLAVLEGLGFISLATKIRLVSSIGGLATLLLSLHLGFGLWSIALQSIASVASAFILIHLGAGWYIQKLKKFQKCGRFSWRQEAWSFQWQTAISAACGWFIFHAMTPALFKSVGPVEAGKFGLGMQIAMGIQTLSMVWIQVRSPGWGKLVASQDWDGLEQDWFRAQRKAIIFSVIASILLFLPFMVAEKNDWIDGDRIPNIYVLIPLTLVSMCNVWIFGIATYLRSFKKEPFLMISIFGAFLMGFIVTNDSLLTPQRLAWAYTVMTIIVGGGLGTLVWLRCRAAWRNDRCLNNLQ